MAYEDAIINTLMRALDKADAEAKSAESARQEPTETEDSSNTEPPERPRSASASPTDTPVARRRGRWARRFR